MTKYTKENIESIIEKVVFEENGLVGALSDNDLKDMKKAVKQANINVKIVSDKFKMVKGYSVVRLAPFFPHMRANAIAQAYINCDLLPLFADNYAKTLNIPSRAPATAKNEITGRVVAYVVHRLGLGPFEYNAKVMRMVIKSYSTPLMRQTFRHGSTEAVVALIHNKEINPGLIGTIIKSTDNFSSRDSKSPDFKSAANMVIQYFTALSKSLDFFNELNEYYDDLEKKKVFIQQSQANQDAVESRDYSNVWHSDIPVDDVATDVSMEGVNPQIESNDESGGQHEVTGRGMTSPYLRGDEGPFINHIEATTGSMGANTSIADNLPPTSDLCKMVQDSQPREEVVAKVHIDRSDVNPFIGDSADSVIGSGNKPGSYDRQEPTK